MSELEPTDAFPSDEPVAAPMTARQEPQPPPGEEGTHWLGTIGSWLWGSLTENLMLKAVSLILALSLWAMVSEEPDVESSFVVPVNVTLPPRLVAISPPTNSVTVFIRGSRSKLKSLSQRALELPVDLSDASSGETRYSFENARISNLPSGVTVVGFSPAHIVVSLDTVTTRSVAIKLRTEGTLPEGVELRSQELKPNRISISGPRTELEGLTELRTQAVDLSQIQSTTTQMVALQIDSPHIRLQNASEQVQVTLRVEATEGSRRVEGVPVTMANGLERYEVKPGQVAVQVIGNDKELELLEPEDMRVIVEQQGEVTEKPIRSASARFSIRGDVSGPFRLRVQLPVSRSLRVRRLEPGVVEVRLAKDTRKPGRTPGTD